MISTFSSLLCISPDLMLETLSNDLTDSSGLCGCQGACDPRDHWSWPLIGHGEGCGPLIGSLWPALLPLSGPGNAGENVGGEIRRGISSHYQPPNIDEQSVTVVTGAIMIERN